MGMAVVPVAMAPVAMPMRAAGGGRHFSVGGCTNIAGDAAAVAIASAVPYVPRNTCYTVQGVPTTRLLANPAELEVEQRQFWCLDELA